MAQNTILGDNTISQNARYDLDDETTRERLTQGRISVQAGQPLRIMMDENGSTGLTWIVDEESCEGLSFQSQLGQPVQASNENDRKQGMVGVPGTRYIDITVTEVQRCTINLVYARPWELDYSDANKQKYAKRISIPVEIVPE